MTERPQKAKKPGRLSRAVTCAAAVGLSLTIANGLAIASSAGQATSEPEQRFVVVPDQPREIVVVVQNTPQAAATATTAIPTTVEAVTPPTSPPPPSTVPEPVGESGGS